MVFYVKKDDENNIQYCLSRDNYFVHINFFSAMWLFIENKKINQNKTQLTKNGLRSQISLRKEIK